MKRFRPPVGCPTQDRLYVNVSGQALMLNCGSEWKVRSCLRGEGLALVRRWYNEGQARPEGDVGESVIDGSMDLIAWFSPGEEPTGCPNITSLEEIMKLQFVEIRWT